MIKCTEYRMGKPRTITDKPLKRNEPLELSAKLKLAPTVEEKQKLLSTFMGDLFYAFGVKRQAWKDYLTYEENMNGTQEKD